MTRGDLLNGYRRLQDALRSALLAVGDGAIHRPTVGHEREDIVAAALAEHLSGIQMRRGQIRSPTLGLSTEWDVIVCDARAPKRLGGSSSVVPIESVLAVVSVKSQLDGRAVTEAVQAAARLRQFTTIDGANRPLPAVFAFGVDGISPAALQKALHSAQRTHGDGGFLNGVVVLGDYTAEHAGGEDYEVTQDEDAYARFIMALSKAVEQAPRRVFSLAPYLEEAASLQGGPSSEGGPLDEDEGGAATPSTPVRPVPRPGGGALALRDRRESIDFAASRTTARLVAEVAAHDTKGADRLRAACASSDPPASLSALAVEASGALADAVGRLLAFLDRPAEAAVVFERLAAEGGDDRPRALVNAAATWDAAGRPDLARPLLEAAHTEAAEAAVVVLADVADLDDPAERLRRLEALQVTNARDRARLVAIRGASLSELDCDGEGVDEVRAALDAYWTTDLAERLAIMLTRSVRVGDRDETPLGEAVHVLDDLVDELLALGRPATALQIDARLLQTLLRLGRHDLAQEVSAYWVAHADDGDDDGRAAMASVLLDAIAPQEAISVAPSVLPDTIAGCLLGARLSLLTEEGEPRDPGTPEVAAAIATMDELLARNLPREDRLPVAQARAMAAADGQAAWSETAWTVVADESVFYADMLRARHLSSQGQRQDAQAVLLRHAEGPDGIRALIDLAVEEGQWDRVVHLVEDGLGDQAPPVERLRRADALSRLGRSTAAETAYAELAMAADTDPFMSERAWFRLTTSLSERRQWDVLATEARQWYERRVDSPMALWVAADALARTGKPEEAWHLIARDGRVPETAAQRRLMAQLAGMVLPLAEALSLIASLSDAVDRSDEQLEAILINVAVGEDKTDLPPELEERVRQTFADFPERFPDSRIIRQIKAPETEEEWFAFAEDELSERRRAAENIDRAVRRGEVPLATFGRLGGTSLSIWLEAHALPLVAPVEELKRADRDAAIAAVATPAVWDASALAVLALLPDDVAAALARVLPASTAPRAVHIEVDGLDRFLAERDPQRSAGSLTVEGGRPILVERTVEDWRSLKTHGERVRALATRLAVADPDFAGSGELAAMLRDADLHGAAISFMSALLLAQQRGVPLFCDDRVIRNLARSIGVPAFGTVALLDVAREHGLLDPAVASTSLWTLRGAGGQSLPPSTQELLRRLDYDDYEPTKETTALLRDPDAWLGEPAREFTRWCDALRAIWHSRPASLFDWLTRVIQDVSGTINSSRAATAAALVMPILGASERDLPYARALLATMHRCNLEAFTIGDPLAAAFVEIRRNQHRLETSGLIDIYLTLALSRIPISEAQRILDLGI